MAKFAQSCVGARPQAATSCLIRLIMRLSKGEHPKGVAVVATLLLVLPMIASAVLVFGSQPSGAAGSTVNPSSAPYQLAYQAWQPASGSQAGLNEIVGTPVSQYLVNQDGSGHQLLNTNNPGTQDSDSEAVSWSPDGQSLAYLNDGSNQVYSESVNQDGSVVGSPVALGPYQNCGGSPPSSPVMAWSPDSMKVAIAGTCGGAIQVVSATGSGTQFSLVQNGYAPTWSIRDQIAYTNGTQIMIQGPQSSTPDATYPVPISFGSTGMQALSFSPDGTQLAIEGYDIAVGRGPQGGPTESIYIMDVRTGATQFFYQFPGASHYSNHPATEYCNLGNEAWSPDGKEIACGLYDDETNDPSAPASCNNSNGQILQGIQTINVLGASLNPPLEQTCNLATFAERNAPPAWRPTQFKFIVYVDVPLAPYPSAINNVWDGLRHIVTAVKNVFEVGHTFVQLVDSRNSPPTRTTLGLYPVLSLFLPPGKVTTNDTNSWQYRIVYNISAATYDKLQTFLKSEVQITGNGLNGAYNYANLPGQLNNGQNCVGFAQYTASLAGITLPDPNSILPALVPGLGLVPLSVPNSIAFQKRLAGLISSGQTTVPGDGTVQANTNGSQASGAPDPPQPYPEDGDPVALADAALSNAPELASAYGFRYDQRSFGTIAAGPGTTVTLAESDAALPNGAMYAIDWGDGSSPSLLGLMPGMAGAVPSLTHQYAAAGSFSYRLFVLQTAAVEEYDGTVSVTNGLPTPNSQQFSVPTAPTPTPTPAEGGFDPAYPSGAPSQPTFARATPTGGGATVTWSPPSFGGTDPITSYTVTAAPGGASATVDGSTTTAVLTGLTDGTTYTFSVSAMNGAGTGPPVTATAVPGTPPLTWTTNASPNQGSGDNRLNGVSCTSAIACVAVGYYLNSSGVENTLIETSNGTNWSEVPSPSPDSSLNDLQGVSCTSPSFCAAVGYTSTGPLVEMWNGSSWSVESTPSGATGYFSAVSCTSPTSCLAVGPYLAESWNGLNWSLAPYLDQGVRGSYLTAVSCVASSGCAAVGYYITDSGNNGTLVETWDGSNWAIAPSSSPSANPNQLLDNLHGVSCADTATCVGVGTHVDTVGNTVTGNTLVESMAPSGWSDAPSPDNGSNGNVLYGVSCSDVTDCVAVGTYANASFTQWDTFIESISGTSWSIRQSPNPSAGRNTLNGVSCPTSISCVAVGDFVNAGGTSQTLVETENGGSAQVPPTISSAATDSVSSGTAFSYPVTTTGSPTPAISLASGSSLPSGVTLTDSGNGTATLAGNASVPAGVYSFAIQAMSNAGTITQAFTLSVTGGATQAPVFTSAASDSVTVGGSFIYSVQTTGSPTPALSLASGSTLPVGVTLSDNHDGSATLAGSSTVAAGVYSFTMQATNGLSPDAKQAFTLHVGSSPSITSVNSASFPTFGVSTFTITTTGGPTPGITELGALPSGVMFSDNGNGTATVSGRPTVAGTFPLTLTASNGTAPNGSQSFLLYAGLQITSASLPGATHSSYRAQVAAVGGTGPYKWKAKGLPKGLKMNKTTGQVTGIPVVKAHAGSYPVTFGVQDTKVKHGPGAHPKESATRTLTLILS
jgi:hypothetical protein